MAYAVIGLYGLGCVLVYQIWWVQACHVPPKVRDGYTWQNWLITFGWPILAVRILYFQFFLRKQDDEKHQKAFEQFDASLKKEIDAALTERYEEDKVDGNVSIN